MGHAAHTLKGHSIPSIPQCTDGHQKQSIQRRFASDIAVRRQTYCNPQSAFGAAKTRLLALSRPRDLIKCNGIGFELGIEPNRGAEENARKLYTAAYSLLLMHDVLKSKAGSAFLKVLLHLQKGSPEHLLSAYGEWFTEIASSGHISWQDYLLDEIISGKGNPLAKAAARGKASGEGSMQRAAAYDLDVLQRLAVTETTLAGWVSHMVNTPEGWLPAAAPSDGIGRQEESSSGKEPSISQQDREDWIKKPLTAAQRRAWRDKLGGSWKWSEALPDLLALWQAHGTGLVAKHDTLYFQEGALTAPSPATDVHLPSTDLRVHPFPEGLQKLLDAVENGWSSSHDEGASHASGICSRKECKLLAKAMYHGARVVIVPQGGLSDKGMDALARALGQHRRIVFFALYVWRGEASTVPAECRRALAMAQDGSNNWPSNAHLLLMVDSTDCDVPMPDLRGEAHL